MQVRRLKAELPTAQPINAVEQAARLFALASCLHCA
jgi:hypothetical protein